jgi:hypothetical protein
MSVVKLGVSQSPSKLSAIGQNTIVPARSPISAPRGPAIWLLRVVPTILLCRHLDEKSHGQRRPHQTDTSGSAECLFVIRYIYRQQFLVEQFCSSP